MSLPFPPCLSSSFPGEAPGRLDECDPATTITPGATEQLRARLFWLDAVDRWAMGTPYQVCACMIREPWNPSLAPAVRCLACGGGALVLVVGARVSRDHALRRRREAHAVEAALHFLHSLHDLAAMRRVAFTLSSDPGPSP